jgi:hypothetical protein
MKFHEIGSTKLSARFVLPVVALTVLSIMLIEWRSLYKLDHPKPHKLDCITCHSDKHTLKAMADKADDPLYLVHSGQLTVADLNKLMSKQEQPGAWKAK